MIDLRASPRAELQAQLDPGVQTTVSRVCPSAQAGWDDCGYQCPGPLQTCCPSVPRVDFAYCVLCEWGWMDRTEARQMLASGDWLNCSPHYFWRQGLSPNLEHADLARPAGQQASEVPVSASLQLGLWLHAETSSVLQHMCWRPNSTLCAQQALYCVSHLVSQAMTLG